MTKIKEKVLKEILKRESCPNDEARIAIDLTLKEVKKEVEEKLISFKKVQSGVTKNPKLWNVYDNFINHLKELLNKIGGKDD